MHVVQTKPKPEVTFATVNSANPLIKPQLAV